MDILKFLKDTWRPTWHKDILDTRDYTYSPDVSATLKGSVDITDSRLPIRHQGKIGSCLSHTLIRLIEHKYLAMGRELPDSELSELYHYFNMRKRMGTFPHDSGGRYRDGLKVCQKQGICSEVLWPYDISKVNRYPLKKCDKDAKNRKILSYYRLKGEGFFRTNYGTLIRDIVGCLNEGLQIAYGLMLTSSFMVGPVVDSGIIPAPAASEKGIGGHALDLESLSISKELLEKVQDLKYKLSLKDLTKHDRCPKNPNSWGEKWGNKGYYDIQLKHILMYGRDFHVIKECN